MYQGLISLLGSVFISMLWTYILKVNVKFYNITGLKLGKPFTCGFCLSFWLCFISLVLKTTLINSIFISSISPFLFLIIEDYYTNKFRL